MTRMLKASAVATLAVVMVAATTFDAEAQSRRSRVATGVAIGVGIGLLAAGAAAARAAPAERVYVAPRRNCSEFRRLARYNEDIGRPNRAAYYWDQYSACRGE